MPYLRYLNSDHSHEMVGQIGGSPSVPEDFRLPERHDKNGSMSFFFQIFFPEYHTMKDYTALFFFDIFDCDENHIIPPLSTPDNYPKSLDPSLLRENQKYFNCKIFRKDSVKPNPSILSPVLYNKVFLSEDPAENGLMGRIEYAPQWLMGDETPPVFENSKPIFCFQIKENFIFPKISTAPDQILVDYFSESGKSPSRKPGYEIFAANETFFFAYKYDIISIPFVTVQNSS